MKIQYKSAINEQQLSKAKQFANSFEAYIPAVENINSYVKEAKKTCEQMKMTPISIAPRIDVKPQDSKSLVKEYTRVLKLTAKMTDLGTRYLVLDLPKISPVHARTALTYIKKGDNATALEHLADRVTDKEIREQVQKIGTNKLGSIIEEAMNGLSEAEKKKLKKVKITFENFPTTEYDMLFRSPQELKEGVSRLKKKLKSNKVGLALDIKHFYLAMFKESTYAYNYTNMYADNLKNLKIRDRAVKAMQDFYVGWGSYFSKSDQGYMKSLMRKMRSGELTRTELNRLNKMLAPQIQKQTRVFNNRKRTYREPMPSKAIFNAFLKSLKSLPSDYMHFTDLSPGFFMSISKKETKKLSPGTSSISRINPELAFGSAAEQLNAAANIPVYNRETKKVEYFMPQRGVPIYHDFAAKGVERGTFFKGTKADRIIKAIKDRKKAVLTMESDMRFYDEVTMRKAKKQVSRFKRIAGKKKKVMG